MSESRSFYFGTPDAPVHGTLSLGGTRGRGPRGAVICPPLGYEELGAYRPLRTLASALADRGVPTLRFDWQGTGDSADRSTALAPGWTKTVAAAVGTLRDVTGVTEIALVGLRFGATVAALAVGEGVEAAELVLIAPYATGRACLRELAAFHALAAHWFGDPPESAAPPEAGALEASGFVLSPTTVRELGSIDLASLAAGSMRARSALILSPRIGGQEVRVEEALASAGVEVEVRQTTGIEHLYDDAQRSALPPNVSDIVVARIAPFAQDGPPAVRDAPRLEQTAAVRVDGMEVRETAMRIESDGRSLSGVACEPTGSVGDRWLLFLNAGGVRRVGPGRLWTTMARREASRGSASLRLDVRGVGDSDGDAGLDTNPGEHLDGYYSTDAVRDLRAWVDVLEQANGARAFAAIGLCSGGFVGLHAALLDPRIRSVCLVNPQVLFWDTSAATAHTFRHARRLLTRPGLWLRGLRRGRSRIGEVARGSLAAIRPSARHDRTGAHIVDALTSLAERGTAVHFVFSAGDLGLAYLEQHLGSSFASRLEAAGATVDVVAGPDHTFRPAWSQPLLQELLRAHVERDGFCSAATPAAP